MDSARYSRQILAFGEEGQQKIAVSKVGIVGLGGMGAQVAQSLAYLGVASFVLVDDDHVDHSNLNRLVGAYPEDAQERQPKVHVAQRHINKINPDAKCIAIDRNLRTKVALSALMEDCPVIFGCVDHDGPRLVLMELAAAYDKILIDSAVELFPKDGLLSDQDGGRVVVCRPGEYCLDCARQIDTEHAKMELDSPEVCELRRKHGYGLADVGPSPAVITINAIVANLAVNEFIAQVTGFRDPVIHQTYYFMRGATKRRVDGRRKDCYTCGCVAGSGDHINIMRYCL